MYVVCYAVCCVSYDLELDQTTTVERVSLVSRPSGISEHHTDALSGSSNPPSPSEHHTGRTPLALSALLLYLVLPGNGIIIVTG
jgi:hypothetical protein